MGIIREKILYVGEKSDLVIETIFDSGASYSFIKKELALKLGNVSKTRIARSFRTAENGRQIVVDETIRLDFIMDKENLSDEFLVSDFLAYDATIGVHTMQKWHLRLDFDLDTVIVDHDVAGLLLI